MTYTLEQFGQKIKDQYPAYNSFSNVDLANKVLEKYPQYKSQVHMPVGSQTDKPGPNLYENNRGIAQKTAGFLGVEKLGQGTATAIRTLQTDTLAQAANPLANRPTHSAAPINQSGNEQGAALTQLSDILKKYPVGSPERKAAVEKYTGRYKGSNDVPTQAEVDPGTKLSNRDVVGSAAKTASMFVPGAKGLALFGAGNAIEKGRGVVGTVTEAGLTALGGKLLDKGMAATFNKVFPAVSQYLEKVNLRLTPTQKTNLGNTLADITEFLSKKKIVGTPEGRFEKVDALYDQTENTLQKFLKDTAKGRTADKQQVLQGLDTIKNQFADDADRLDIIKQIDRAKTNIQTGYGEKIPLDRLNTLKRSIYKNAYNKAGDKVRDDVEHAIGDVLKNTIEDATKGLKINGQDIGAFNKEYGTLINARKLLKIAQGRNQLGFMGRLVSAFAGSKLGGAMGGGMVGEAAGAVAGGSLGQLVAGTPTRSAIGAGFQLASKINPKGVSRIAAPLIDNLR